MKISMFNLVAIIKESLPNNNNRYYPKIDTQNYDASYHFEVGISMTFMNWQSYPKYYLEGNAEKNDEIRYIFSKNSIIQKGNRCSAA